MILFQSFLLFVTLLVAVQASLTEPLSRGDNGKAIAVKVDTPDRDLYGCARQFACGDYAILFASASQAQENPESYYASVATVNGTVCHVSFDSVLLLGNVKQCQNVIQSVKFALTYPTGTIRLWTESMYPYTVFRVTNGVFESRNLDPGRYKLNVKIYDDNSCLLVDHRYDFDIDGKIECDGGDIEPS